MLGSIDLPMAPLLRAAWIDLPFRPVSCCHLRWLVIAYGELVGGTLWFIVSDPVFWCNNAIFLFRQLLAIFCTSRYVQGARGCRDRVPRLHALPWTCRVPKWFPLMFNFLVWYCLVDHVIMKDSLDCRLTKSSKSLPKSLPKSMPKLMSNLLPTAKVGITFNPGVTG